MQHQPHHHHQHHQQQRRHTLAYRSTRSTRSSISNNDYDYHPLLLASSVLSPAAQVAVARGRSLPTTTTTTTTTAALAPAAPTSAAIPPRPAPTPAAPTPASNGPALPPLQLQLQLQSLLLPPKLRPYPLTNPLALRDCVPDAHPDDANDPYLVAAYACLRAHNNKAMTLDAISAWCHRNHLLSRSQESEPHLRDHLRSHLTRHPDRRNALFTWFPLTANHSHLKDALHNPALVLTSRTTHVWYISQAGRAQCPFARLGWNINNTNCSTNNTTSQFSKRKSPPQGAASVTADANRSTKIRITLRLPPKSLFPSRPRPRPRPRTRPRPSLLSSQAPSRLFPHAHLSDPIHRHHHSLGQQDNHHDEEEEEEEDGDHDGDDGDDDDDDNNDDNDDDNDDDDDDDDDDNESASDTDYSSDDDNLLHHSIISPVGPISIPTFRPAHDPLSIHVLCPFALDSNPPPDSEDEADDFHNSMLRQDIQSDSEFSIKHEFIPVDLPPIIDHVNVKQHLGTALPTDVPLHEWHHQHQYSPLSLPIAPTHHAAVVPDDASPTIKHDNDESHPLDAWSTLGSEREQSVASTAPFPVPFSPPSTSTEDTMSPSPTPPSDCGDAPTVKTEEDSAPLPLSVPVSVLAPEEEEVFPIDAINPLEPSSSSTAAAVNAAPALPLPESHPHWEDGPICGPESVSPDDVDIFWGAGKRPTPAESSKMATERAIRAGRTRLHLHTSQQALALRRFSNANSEPPARVDRMCSMSSVASDWTADDSECALLTPAHTGWKMSSNWNLWPLERQTTAVKLPENKVKSELPIKVEPKEDELAIPASDKLKRLLTNAAFSANLHKANCPTIQTRILLGVPVFQCLILYPQVTLLRRMDTDWVNVTTLMQYCSYVTSKAQDGRLPPPPARADLPPQAVYVESSSPLIHGAWAPLGIARSVARAHDTVPWIKRTFLGDALAGKFAASAVTEAKACLAHEVPAGAGIGAQFARPSVLSADELKPPRAPLGIRSAHSLGTVPLTPLDLLPKAELFASFNNPPSTPVSKPTILPRSMVAPLGATGEATFPHCVQIKGEHLGPDLIAEPLKPEEEELLREILVTSPAKKEVGRNEEKMEEEEVEEEVEPGESVGDQEDAMEVDEEQEEEEEEEESVPAQSTRSKTRAALPAPMTRSRRAASPASTSSSLSDSEDIPNPVPVRKVGRPSKATIAERKAAKAKAKAEKGAESDDDDDAQPRRSGRMQAKAAAAAAAKAEAKKKASKARAAPTPRQSLSTVALPTKSASGRSLRAIARSRA